MEVSECFCVAASGQQRRTRHLSGDEEEEETAARDSDCVSLGKNGDQ